LPHNSITNSINNVGCVIPQGNAPAQITNKKTNNERPER
jgi:hypothetical protein